MTRFVHERLPRSLLLIVFSAVACAAQWRILTQRRSSLSRATAGLPS